MPALAVARDRCFCGALLFEDREFAAQAAMNLLKVRRERCTAGHTHYRNANPPPPDPPRGAPIAPGGLKYPTSRRVCIACVKPFRKKPGKRQLLCDDCKAIKPCSRCNGRGKHYPACPRNT